ncbi:MAG: aminotransferase class I/II-fold pyridoxal phosphate-dependent enzyme [Acidimicrobiia bacterium]
MAPGDHNPAAMTVGPETYGQGSILARTEDEARRSMQGRRMIRERVMAQGKDSIYNLTGLVRGFPLTLDDLDNLENQFTFYTHYLGRAEAMAVEYTGADPQEFDAAICNRVTSAMLAIMLGTLERGDRVLSLVPRSRSHPSVQQAVELAGAAFHEVQGLEALEQALRQGPWKMLVITPLTPSKNHLPAAEIRRAISLAKASDQIVFVDDAHMMSRSIFYDEPVAFGLGEVDVAVWSLDKHVPGPRGAAIIGRKALMQSISAQVFQFGLEAQSGHYVAMVRGMEAFDPEPIRQAGELARTLFQRLQPRFGPQLYQAGPGVAMAAEDFARAVCEQAGTQETPLAPAEISITGCFLLFEHYGIITIPIVGAPGAAPTFRLMMHPDGARFGLERLEEAVVASIDQTAGLLQKPEAVRQLLLGEEG